LAGYFLAVRVGLLGGSLKKYQTLAVPVFVLLTHVLTVLSDIAIIFILDLEQKHRTVRLNRPTGHLATLC